MNRMVDERKDFNVIFVVYSTEYESFVSANAGILSRCTRYDFKDYTPDQLTEIFKKMCRDSKDFYDQKAIDKIHIYFEVLYKNRTDKTGNARAVQKLITEMRKRRYPRIKGIKNASPQDKYCFIETDVPDYE